MAEKSCGKPEIFNSAQRNQFTRSEFVAELRTHDIQISMDRRRRCWDNAKMEHFWWALKYEDTKSMSNQLAAAQLKYSALYRDY